MIPHDVEPALRALLQAMAEAQAMANTGQLGSDLRELLQHARELLDIIDQGIAEAAGFRVGGELQSTLALMRSRLSVIERLAAPHLH